MSADPDTLVPLTSARTEFEANVIAEALRAQGIPAEVFATAASTLQWEAGYTDPIKVMVRRADVERAAGVARAIKAESVDIDWSEVEAADPEPAPLSSTKPLPSSVLSASQRRGIALGWLLFFGPMVTLLFAYQWRPGMLITALFTCMVLLWAWRKPAASPR